MSETSVKDDLKRLQEIGTELARMASRLPSITNQLMYGAMKKSVDEMYKDQTALVKRIVARSKDEAARNRFMQLSQQVESAEGRIAKCQDHAELKELGKELEKAIEEEVALFTQIVADLLKAEEASPPESAASEAGT